MSGSMPFTLSKRCAFVIASVTYAAVASSPAAESASVSSVMKFRFTQLPRSRWTHSRRRSLSTWAMNVFASSAVGCADTLGGAPLAAGGGGARLRRDGRRRLLARGRGEQQEGGGERNEEEAFHGRVLTALRPP